MGELIRGVRRNGRLAVQAAVRPILSFVSLPHACLLVCRNGVVSTEKLRRIRERLEYAFGHALSGQDLRVVGSLALIDVLKARVVVEVDQGTVPRWMHQVFPHVVLLDYERHAFDAWGMARVAFELDRDAIVRRRAEVRERFTGFVRRTMARNLACAYLFGTGPSLERARERSFADGYVVVCNTIVRDPDMWRHLRPDFIAAGDAIYHFGHTEHARAFRRDLKARLSESAGSTMFVYPEMFDAIVRREFAGLESQLAPLPFGSHSDVTVSLLERAILPASSNVLNILLLPIGCTLSRRINLWGFDGRAPTDALFWSNSTMHAYPELMPALVDEHPAFYETLVPKGREVEYVKNVHGDELDRRLTSAEERGYEFVMMHPSWTETLNRRYCGVAESADAR